MDRKELDKALNRQRELIDLAASLTRERNALRVGRDEARRLLDKATTRLSGKQWQINRLIKERDESDRCADEAYEERDVAYEERDKALNRWKALTVRFEALEKRQRERARCRDGSHNIRVTSSGGGYEAL